MKHLKSLHTLIWREIDTLSLILFLISFEAIALLYDLRTSIIYDWTPIIFPFIWINTSILFTYLLLKYLYLKRESASWNEGNRYMRYLSPDFRNLSIILSNRKVRVLLFIAAISYFTIYSYLQGMLLIDLGGGIETRFSIVYTLFGYGPVIIYAPTKFLAIVVNPYLLSAAIALSIYSGLSITLLIVLITSLKKVKKILPAPLLGLSVVCPTCILSPATAFFISTLSISSAIFTGSLPLQNLLYILSTILLISTLTLLWISISILSKTPVKIK